MSKRNQDQINMDRAAKKALAQTATKNVTIKFDRAWDEYCVPSPDGTPASAYFTSDKHDAIGTAKAMWKDYKITIKFRKVN